MADTTNSKSIAENRKAWHEYFVLKSLEAGIELVGTEVKSIRMGGVNLKDAWIDVINGEMMVMGMHISPYEKGNIFNRDPLRPRRLLCHKREVIELHSELKLQGLTLIPLKMYFKGSRVKVQVGLCKGKHLYDKRADIAAKDAKRDIARAMKERTRESY